MHQDMLELLRVVSWKCAKYSTYCKNPSPIIFMSTIFPLVDIIIFRKSTVDFHVISCLFLMLFMLQRWLQLVLSPYRSESIFRRGYYFYYSPCRRHHHLLIHHLWISAIYLLY